MNDHQYRLWKHMINLINDYISNKDKNFFSMVGGLEGALDASEIADEDLIDQWYDLWGPLEILRAVKGNQVTKIEAMDDLLAMKKFLLRRLETFREQREQIDSLSIKNLSFPGFKVEDMEFSPEEKRLSIFIEGAWLEEEGGQVLGKGLLLFHHWESLTISRLNPVTQVWVLLDNTDSESLKDIQEFKWLDTTVYLRGVGEKTRMLIEWKIVNAQICAEFEPETGLYL